MLKYFSLKFNIFPLFDMQYFYKKEIIQELSPSSPSMTVLVQSHLLTSFRFFDLNNLNLSLTLQFPLNIIFSQDLIKSYNLIFKFLVKIRRAKFNLTSKKYLIILFFFKYILVIFSKK